MRDRLNSGFWSVKYTYATLSFRCARPVLVSRPRQEFFSAQRIIDNGPVCHPGYFLMEKETKK